MARFVKGDVIIGWFPFSNTIGSKKRPALVIASWTRRDAFQQGEDYLLCMISTQNVNDPYSFALQVQDVENGSLNKASYVRPSYLFSADEGTISHKVGTLKKEKFDLVIEAIRRLVP